MTVRTDALKKIAQAAAAVEHGDYESAALAGLLDRQDEVGQLGRAFDRMAREVAARDRRFGLLRVLIPAGVAMSAEKDFNRLLETIVIEAQEITRADGGTLYLRTDDEQLRFVIVRNISLDIALGGTTGRAVTFTPLPLYLPDGSPNQHHIATAAAFNHKRFTVADAYQAQDFDFSGTKAFDQNTGYRSKSFLTIPLEGERGEVIGILQLINALDPETGAIVAFAVDDVVECLAMLASAALSGYIREEGLRAEIAQLRIEVDQVKQARLVADITDSDYFQQLQARARKLRDERGK